MTSKKKQQFSNKSFFEFWLGVYEETKLKALKGFCAIRVVFNLLMFFFYNFLNVYVILESFDAWHLFNFIILGVIPNYCVLK